MNHKTEKQFTALTRCFYCGEAGDLLIHKRLRDLSHLHNKVVSTEPCAKCAEYMKQGVIFLSCRAPKNEEEQKNPYRTGGYWVMKEEAVRRAIMEPLLSQILESRVTFITNEDARSMGMPGAENLVD